VGSFAQAVRQAARRARVYIFGMTWKEKYRLALRSVTLLIILAAIAVQIKAIFVQKDTIRLQKLTLENLRKSNAELEKNLHPERMVGTP
jgi:hypothetical protein